MKAIFLIILVVGLIFIAGCPQEKTSKAKEEWKTILSECTDSDHGQDEFTLGVAHGPSGNGTDRCIGKNEKVLEYYCSGGKLKHKNILCPSGYECSNGACRQINCFDSDGGKDTSVFGTVKYGEQYKDVCVGKNSVREYFCGKNKSVEAEEMSCSENQICSNGRCVDIEVCTDSDDGDKGKIKGTITLGSASYTDKCVGYDVVYEYYCKDNALQTKQITCPKGEACKDGVCAEAEIHECKDTDKGKSVYTKGKVTYWSGGEKYSETDKCYDQNSVLEVWCTETGSIGFGIIECDDGDWCENGRCTGA